ncbi:tetratricopeptide repeat protein [Novosphingobium sp.]|uniref:tetratricopeptide repeat protein n=1 Tax=Novosphingobium sp. TaxID=1874826 RepID=UPI002734829E|nr:tetratricopeptide repeat protein [Novosphingobium sp.]MDP3907285.1 tetratricopeptide repeat protein [Novosphingobium sp.]
MGWVLVGALAALVFAALVWGFKAPRKGWEAIGAALMLGVAGYALQGSPAQPGAPKLPAAQTREGAAALVAARQELARDGAANASSWVMISDALARNGQYSDAAGVVLGAIEKDPKNADAWLALGNYLMGHTEGVLSPAALYAYSRAAAADPQHPGPAFFQGLALAQNGRFAEGRALWADLLVRAPKDAPWRADLVDRLVRLDAFIAAQDKPAAAAPAAR